MQGYFDENGLPGGVDFVSVSTGANPSRTNYPPNLWLDREGWTAPVIVDNEQGEAAGAFGLSGFPFWAAVSADGQMVGRFVGMQSSENLEELAEFLLNL